MSGQKDHPLALGNRLIEMMQAFKSDISGQLFFVISYQITGLKKMTAHILKDSFWRLPFVPPNSSGLQRQ